MTKESSFEIRFHWKARTISAAEVEKYRVVGVYIYIYIIRKKDSDIFVVIRDCQEKKGMKYSLDSGQGIFSVRSFVGGLGRVEITLFFVIPISLFSRWRIVGMIALCLCGIVQRDKKKKKNIYVYAKVVQYFIARNLLLTIYGYSLY